VNKKNVLIFPSGAENAINVYDSLKYNLHFELFGASSKDDHSSYIYDSRHLKVGNYNIHDKRFLRNFNLLIDKWHIDFIIPTHDEISLFLMLNQDSIHATVVCSPAKTCEVAFSKLKTFYYLKNKSYIPKIYNYGDEISYPVFIKPDIGAGGKGTYLIENESSLLQHLGSGSFLISEYLPGDEITVDCFTNKDRKLLFVGPRTRERITSGVSFRTQKVNLTDEIQNIADDLNSTFSFRGMWFFQLKKDKNNKYKLMEISVRCAGTMALYRQIGINFAAMSLFDFMEYDVSILRNSFSIQLDRYYKCCYLSDLKYKNIYLDFDDTLVIDGKVNSTLMLLIYQWVNDNKNIYLISKHKTNIYDDLNKVKISKYLFKKIIVIPLLDCKVNYIKKNNAIFIDNYFFERKEVYEKLGIPVFDVDAIESLIKYDKI